MPSWLLITLAAVVVVAAASQIALPPLAQSRVEGHLTTGGGTARVELAAFPAARLLLTSGSRLEVVGADLTLEVTPQEDSDGLAALDGFDEVSIELADSEIGPLDVREFSLRRDGESPYEMRMLARTTGADLIAQAGGALGIAGSGLLGSIASQTPIASEPFNLEVDASLESSDGSVRIVSGDGRVAGYSVGPIAGLIASAISRQIEVGP